MRRPLDSPPCPAVLRVDAGGLGTAVSLLWAGMASCTACVDTSIPLVTAAERTATLFGSEVRERPFV